MILYTRLFSAYSTMRSGWRELPSSREPGHDVYIEHLLNWGGKHLKTARLGAVTSAADLRIELIDIGCLR